MSKPAARVGDMHVCPMVTPGTPPVPHVGGPITGPGVPTVFIGGMPAAVMGDMCTCVGPPDSIILGSMGVFIGGKPAARMGDSCIHGGTITVGCPTVFIGEMSGGGGGGGAMANVQVVIDAIDKVEGVEKSILAKVKVMVAQVATMKEAAADGLDIALADHVFSQEKLTSLEKESTSYAGYESEEGNIGLNAHKDILPVFWARLKKMGLNTGFNIKTKDGGSQTGKSKGEIDLIINVIINDEVIPHVFDLKNNVKVKGKWIAQIKKYSKYDRREKNKKNESEQNRRVTEDVPMGDGVSDVSLSELLSEDQLKIVLKPIQVKKGSKTKTYFLSLPEKNDVGIFQYTHITTPNE